jgi:hypothetical protein
MFGLAERGLRRVEEPPLGLDQCGLDSCVDPGYQDLHLTRCNSHRESSTISDVEH